MSLVVTADDLGLSPGVTKGILEAHRRGIVRSASLIVTFGTAEEAAALARQEPDLEVGLHIDLVGGGPASELSAVPSLIDEDGRFHPLPEFVRRLATGRIRARELAAEVRAQAALARRWGVPARAWDSHRHVHLMPPVARVVGRLAREEGVRWVRRGTAPRWPGVKGAAIHAASLASGLAYRGIPGNAWYVDLTARRPRLDASALALLPAYGRLGEIGSHPGYPDDVLRSIDPVVNERADDLALLTDPLVRSALDGAIRWRIV
jgi:predicted glycoside hydrolase/deacetylase ChbG (UPF0249 family)